MNHLDLGFIRREGAWEFHPWGPFRSGYRVGQERWEGLRKANRWIKGLCVSAGVLLVIAVFLHLPWRWILGGGILGSLLEILATWWIVRGLEPAKPLGWNVGMLYLVQWMGPLVLGVAQWANRGLILAALGIVIWFPVVLWSYILLGFVVGVEFFLSYVKLLQQTKQ